MRKWLFGVCCVGRAKMPILPESPDNAFVQGGLFARSRHAIPPAAVKVLCRSAEKCGKSTEGVQRLQQGVGSAPVT